MSAQKVVDICSSVSLRCSSLESKKFDFGRHDQIENSYEFRFMGGGWRLHYLYQPNAEWLQHSLSLKRCSGVSPSGPFYVSVRVESSERGRFVEGLSREMRFTDEFRVKDYYYSIWEKSEEDIVEALPEFRHFSVLTFLVVLTAEDVSEDTGELRRSVASTSVQTECLPPEAAGLSARPTASTTLVQTSPDCQESLSRDLSKLLDEGSDPDMEFQCSGQSTAAHGAVVSVRSEVFASMLSSDMLEGRTRVIKIPDIEPDVFRHFLRYIYTGALPDLTLDLALNLYEAGDRYSVMGLARRCAKFLLENLTVENACGVLSVADAHSDEDFRESVIGYMLDQQIPLSGADWQEFCRAHPILANEVLNRFCVKISQR